MKDGRSFFGWLMNSPPPPPRSRLTAAEAVTIAAADPRVRALGQVLPIATAARSDDRVVWRVTSATIGMLWWVEVDDATGTVGEPHQAGQF